MSSSTGIKDLQTAFTTQMGELLAKFEEMNLKIDALSKGTTSKTAKVVEDGEKKPKAAHLRAAQHITALMDHLKDVVKSQDKSSYETPALKELPAVILAADGETTASKKKSKIWPVIKKHPKLLASVMALLDSEDSSTITDLPTVTKTVAKPVKGDNPTVVKRKPVKTTVHAQPDVSPIGSDDEDAE
jgi:hypothetical protein